LKKTVHSYRNKQLRKQKERKKYEIIISKEAKDISKQKESNRILNNTKYRNKEKEKR
jgi:hypothetical protein